MKSKNTHRTWRILPVLLFIVGVLLLIIPLISPYFYIGQDEGDSGRIVIRSGRWLYTAALYEEGEAQKIVDKEDSAWINHSHTMIADHNMQGMWIIIRLDMGEEMVIRKDGDEDQYILVDRIEGLNTENGLTDMNGEEITIKKDQIVTYTCRNLNGEKVVIAVWEYTPVK